jgi:hypothetical protein
MRPHRLTVTGLAFVLALGLVARPAAVTTTATRTDTLPARLTDAEYWKLIEDFSEPNGFFRSDNLVSNELWFQWVIPDLLQRSAQGSVYLGVGPEQNFTFIAALKPKMVFITDVRRGNLHTHLMYKALFELSANRADFVSRLFTKKRPDGLSARSTATELINAYWDPTKTPTGSDADYKANLQAIKDQLTKKRALPLAKEDLDGIEYVYNNFYWFGPAITYNSSGGGGGRGNMAHGQLRRPDDRHRRGQCQPELPGERRELPRAEGPARAQPVRAGRRQLRRIEGVEGRGQVLEGARRDGRGVLSVERRAVPEPGRHLVQLLRQRGHAAARRPEHVHPVVAGRRRRRRWRPGELAGFDAERDQELRRRIGPLAMAGRPARYVLAAVLLWLAFAPPGVLGRPADLPERLTDAAFWRIVEEFSEPNGFFRSDNLVSNEDTFQDLIPDLQLVVRRRGVYLGVGPDQNFSYLAALEPRIAFITDIRRGNLHVHLMYKALFELSADRAEFLSRLFGRTRPPGLDAESSAEALFSAYAVTPPTPGLFEANRMAVLTYLVETKGFDLDAADEAGIASVMRAFYYGGPHLAYGTGGAGRMRYPTFRDLQTSSDPQGRNRAYLGSEARFRVVKRLEEQNLIVPLVGDFAGPKALRSVGRYLRQHGAIVSAFYTSNVEQYLFRNGVWADFARNLQALPLDRNSTIIRACFSRCPFSSTSRSVMLYDSIPRMLSDFEGDRLAQYWDVLARSRPPTLAALVR